MTRCGQCGKLVGDHLRLQCVQCRLGISNREYGRQYQVTRQEVLFKREHRHRMQWRDSTPTWAALPTAGNWFVWNAP